VGKKITREKRKTGGLTFLGYEGFKQQYGVVVAGPPMHFSIAVATLLRQLVPGLRLTQQFAHRALTQAQHVLGEQSLPDVMYREEFAHPPRDVQRIEVLRGVLVHIVAQHLLQPGLHGVAFGYEGLPESAGHSGRPELVAKSERMRALVEAKGTLETVEDAEAADVIVRQVVAVVVVVVAGGLFGRALGRRGRRGRRDGPVHRGRVHDGGRGLKDRQRGQRRRGGRRGRGRGLVPGDRRRRLLRGVEGRGTAAAQRGARLGRCARRGDRICWRRKVV
jgi:hypothetical protein